MTQRTLAGLLAVPLLVALWLAALLVPLPYVTLSPGYTVDTLGSDGEEPLVEVKGERSYDDDDGQLRFTTVFVSEADTDVGLLQALTAWFDPDSAVVPYETQYPPGETDESSRREGAQQMASSQDTAAAVALTELGYQVQVPVVAGVEPGSPSEGVLRKGDEVVAVGDARVRSTGDVVSAVRDAPDGQPVEVRVRRDGGTRTFELEPEQVDGQPRIGASIAAEYDFPFEVDYAVDSDIGGPSAGLMLSLATYDVLTKGSLTGGGVVAGTGSIADDGTVGPIGGIDQKIAGAREAGAGLFLVPPDNCADAADSRPGDMRLARAATVSEALKAVEAWAEDHDADLPRCESGSGGSDA